MGAGSNYVTSDDLELSDTRTVVRECCKGDDAKFSHHPSSGFPRMREIAHQTVYWTLFLGGGLPTLHSQDPPTDFHA